jgi:phosphotransferase system enzyme I (PtsI)
MYRSRKVIRGVSIASGIVLGYARVVLPGDLKIAEIPVPASRVPDEINALQMAVKATIAELNQLREAAGKKIFGPAAKIFDAQLLIASDYEFLKGVEAEIKSSRRNAAFVYNRQVQSTIASLKNSDELYMRQMALDVDAVAERVLEHLIGQDRPDVTFAANTILVGQSFSPGEILMYRQRKAIGFVVNEGARNSHMGLIARALMLPTVRVDASVMDIPYNAPIIIDGVGGEVIVNPTDDDWSTYQKRRRRLGPAAITRVKRLSKIPPVSHDGHAIEIAANLTIPGPADDVLSDRHISIGLYRTEYLYLVRNRFPDEQEQYQYYKAISDRFAAATVVLRTFDIGYDKLAPDLRLDKEENPALGWRGIRYMLEYEDLFRVQIRAMLRASTRRNLRIMLPMVSDISELERANKLIAQVKFDLHKQKIDFDDEIPVGVMIEVPSAALTADKLAEKAAFLSIGTNDLAQYMLAADRMNPKLSPLYSPYHPSVLKLIDLVIKAGHEHHVPVSICGEVAGDTLGLPLFIGMGIDQLSVSPSRIFDICRTVAKIDVSNARHLVHPVLSSGSLNEVTKILESYRKTFQGRKTKRLA